MSKRLKAWWLLLLLALVAGSGTRASAEKVEDLQPTNYTNDFAGVLDSATQDKLNALCLEVQQKAHAQIAIVTINTLDDRDIESFATDLYSKWGIGGKGTGANGQDDKTVNRGVLILLAVKD